MRAVESECEQQPGSGNSNQKSSNGATNGEYDALRESLGDELPPRSAHGHAYGGLSTTRYSTGQKQIGNVGTRDQQHQTANGQQDLQAAAIAIFHLGDARPRWNYIDHLLGQSADYFRHPVGRIAGI